MLTEEMIKKLRQDYKNTHSIYAVAKKNKVEYHTCKKYIGIDNISVDKRKILTRHKKLPAPVTEDIKDIYNISDNISDNEISINDDKKVKDILINEDKKVIQPQQYISSKDYFISSIENILYKLIRRYKKEYNDIDINKLYLHLGTLFDKYLILTGKELQPTSQVIMNFYGDENKVKRLLQSIKKSKEVKG